SPPPPQQQQQQHKWYRSSPNVRCYKCNRIGHFAQDCYSKKLLVGANDGSALAKLHSPSLIFISTWINSIRISTMIDTG
ncbi:unnamed protein product, partial [Rotaria magnacalcarata]